METWRLIQGSRTNTHRFQDSKHHWQRPLGWDLLTAQGTPRKVRLAFTLTSTLTPRIAGILVPSTGCKRTSVAKLSLLKNSKRVRNRLKEVDYRHAPENTVSLPFTAVAVRVEAVCLSKWTVDFQFKQQVLLQA